MRDARLDDRRLASLQRHRLARDLRIERAFEHCERLDHERMKMFADDCRSGPGGEMGDARSVAAILAAAQHDGIFAGDPVLIDVSATRHCSLTAPCKPMARKPIAASLRDSAAAADEAVMTGFFFLSSG